MSDTKSVEPAEEVLWEPRGFYGPMAAARAAYDAVVVEEPIGALFPRTGGPLPVDGDGVDGMFAVLVRPGADVPTPAGMRAARQDMALRMVGAG